jgi:hypothetical protein
MVGMEADLHAAKAALDFAEGAMHELCYVYVCEQGELGVDSEPVVDGYYVGFIEGLKARFAANSNEKHLALSTPNAVLDLHKLMFKGAREQPSGTILGDALAHRAGFKDGKESQPNMLRERKDL